MNKLKLYREYIILAAAAAALLLFIIFRSAGNINYDLPETRILDEAEINRITIDGEDIALTFESVDGEWYIEPEHWLADGGNTGSIARALADLKIVDLISTSGNPEVYELGEKNRILVRAYNGDELLREIYAGKVSSTGVYTYISLPGDDNVYSVRGNLPAKVKDKDSMRDKKFLEIDRDSVLKMTLKDAAGTELTVFKDAQGTWRSNDIPAAPVVTAEAPETTLDDDVKAILPVLDPLRCKSFRYDEPDTPAQWQLSILTEEGEVQLQIWPQDNGVYPARSSQNGYLVNTTPYAAEKILGLFGVLTED